jgi:hypothetical protein
VYILDKGKLAFVPNNFTEIILDGTKVVFTFPKIKNKTFEYNTIRFAKIIFEDFLDSYKEEFRKKAKFSIK